MPARYPSGVLLTLIALLALTAPAQGAPGDPLYVFAPEPPPTPPGQPPPPPVPPPNSYFNGPCGLAVSSVGQVYVADHYHDAVDVFTAGSSQAFLPVYLGQLAGPDPLGGPCALALDSTENLYINAYHREVAKFSPAPAFVPGPIFDQDHPTGVAVDPTGNVYVNNRTHVSVYDSTGAPVLDEGESLRIGEGSLGEGYGLAVSGFPGTAGFLYVPDASTNTVKAYDPSTDTANPVDVIDGADTPDEGFVSLRDSAVAVDRASGEIYVVDNLQPAHTESPQAIVHVFDAGGDYQGHLKHTVVHGAPTGLAVDNSATGTQGRVYVTSGNTHHGGIYAYPANAAITSDPLPPSVPPAPLGGGQLFPTIAIGGPAPPPSGIACEGDACQSLPPEPTDPTLTTLLQGLGNPKVRYRRLCRRRAQRCRPRSRSRSARAGASSAREGATQAPGPAALDGAPAAGPPARASALGFLPGAAGFNAAAYADGGQAATLSGSHPYALELTVGLDQSGGGSGLRSLSFELPPGLLANPAAPGLCSGGEFTTPRSSPFESSESGGSCPGLSQVGTVEVKSGAGGTRRFGLFNLDPAPGAAFALGGSPYGKPLVFDAQVRSDTSGTYLTLDAAEVPQDLELQGLELSLWGAPWDASHNTERGDCLNEKEPSFGWSKCSVGEPLGIRPSAFLTLPTACGEALAFSARASAWQQPGEVSAQALNREPGGQPAPLAGCATLGFDPDPEGFLTVTKASSSSGFVFRLKSEDPGLADPRARIRSHLREAVIELPRGVTLNPSLGAGLEACTPSQLAAESAFEPAGAGCPNGAQIGEFRLRSPFYAGFLRGGIYLAQPDRPGGPVGTENPFDSLLAVYLIAKSADRGILIRVPGELRPDPLDGTLTASFEDLPQLPYTDLEVSFRSGQRAPLVSPPACGAATTRITLRPWAQGAGPQVSKTDSEVDSGIDFGPCPDSSTPPFAPGAVAGGVNSNVGSYTPYYVHLSRKDTEQEITSYSLVLPKGITGKLSGVPFCPEAAIAAARTRQGFDETAAPSCPAAAQVGRTLTGYGVGPALTYAPGRIYLAGPYGGQPLSLVTVNAATVGPFDLGTIVIRSAFKVNPRTAQLEIDAGASDPIPHILRGVPLHLRDIRIYMDRPSFTRNPTSCEASELISTLSGSGARFSDSSDDSRATVRKHFQLLNCLTLGFRPRLGMRLRGGVRRGQHPALRTVLRARPGDASLDRIAVTMPHSLFLAQNHIRAVCTREQFEAERCPAASAYGKAVVHSSLFAEPLRGPVYLRSSSGRLPDLVASLRSGEVRIVLEGKIGPSKEGGIRAFFAEIPDAPIEAFVMQLDGGKRGLLVNSVNTCNSPPQATVKALGQNNRGAIFTTTLRGKCGGRR